MAKIALQAVREQRHFYDERYRTGYMQDFGHVFEATRHRQVSEIFKLLARAGVSPRRVIDYGCGEGRWFSLVHDAFPQAEISGCDISGRALELAGEQWPEAKLTLMEDERVPLPDGEL